MSRYAERDTSRSAKTKNLPFQVVSDDIKVEVLGTKFNVKNYPEDPNIKVALLEGSVMLYDSLESTILKTESDSTIRQTKQKKPH